MEPPGEVNTQSLSLLRLRQEALRGDRGSLVVDNLQAGVLLCFRQQLCRRCFLAAAEAREVPDADGAILSGRSEELAIVADGDPPERPLVPAKAEALAAGEIPESQGGICSNTGQSFPIGSEGNIPDGSLVTLEPAAES